MTALESMMTSRRHLDETDDLLKATLRADYSPGTNQAGDMACADWRFLLPSLRPGLVVCLGAPRNSTLRVLSRFAERIEIVTSDCDDTLLELASRYENVSASPQGAVSLADEDISVIVIGNGKDAPIAADSGDLLETLCDRLVAGGAVYAETDKAARLIGRLEKSRGAASAPSKFALTRYWLTTKGGELRTAVPLGERSISRYFFDTVAPGISLRNRIISKVCRALSSAGLIDIVAPRRAVVIEKDRKSHAGSSLPGYITDLARESDTDLSSFRFGMSARGLYNSNKIVFFLFQPAAKLPSAVVKISRVPEFNDRLENEWQALAALESSRLVPAESYPGGMFFGYRGGLAVLAQKAMHGRPFRSATTAKPDCPVAADGAEWITTLGRNSVRNASASAVAERLLGLFEIFAGIYRLSDAHSKFMRHQIESIAAIERDFPVVQTHGDAGVWNVTVDVEGRTQFLDWEASEPSGMPLWDLFYYIHSFGYWVSRKRDGISNRLEAFERCYMTAGPMNDFLVGATRRYCEQLGIHRSFVAPLFLTSWMHRALREATWAADLETAHFVNLTRKCIDHRDAPGIVALLGEQ